MTPGESHNEWYHYYCSNSIPLRIQWQLCLLGPEPIYTKRRAVYLTLVSTVARVLKVAGGRYACLVQNLFIQKGAGDSSQET